MIRVIRDRATAQQMAEMQEMLVRTSSWQWTLSVVFWLAVVLYMQIVRPSFWRLEASSRVSGEPIGSLQPRKFVTNR